MYKPKLVYISALCTGMILALPIGEANAQNYGQIHNQTNNCSSFWYNPRTRNYECLDFVNETGTTTNSFNRQTSYTTNSSSPNSYVYPVSNSTESTVIKNNNINTSNRNNTFTVRGH